MGSACSGGSSVIASDATKKSTGKVMKMHTLGDIKTSKLDDRRVSKIKIVRSNTESKISETNQIVCIDSPLRAVSNINRHFNMADCKTLGKGASGMVIKTYKRADIE